MENGEHGPPSEEVIVRLSEILDADADELLRLAGRDVGGGASFERQVLSQLRSLRHDMRIVKEAVTGQRPRVLAVTTESVSGAS